MDQGHDYLEAPDEWTGADVQLAERGLFMAGGITGCANWHADYREMLDDSGLILVNPRRSGDQTWDPSISKHQIKWEHRYLRWCRYISFWFTNATLQPIAQYELGAWSMTDKPIFIGVQPGYERAFDVRAQTALVRPRIKVVDSLEELATQVHNFYITEKY